MKKILNPAKPIHAWTLDGTKVGEFPSGREAVDTLCRSQGVISNAARNWKILGGKYIVSYGDVFPGVPEFSHKNASAVWAWTAAGEPIGEYPSQGLASQSLGVSPQSVRDSIKRVSVVKSKYVFTDSPVAPVLSHNQLTVLKKREARKKPAIEKYEKYALEERKWVSLGEFKDMEEASTATGLSARNIHRMAYNGTVWQKNYRAKRKGKLICVEKQEWHPAGKFKTLSEMSGKVGAVCGTILHAVNTNGVIGGKYKVSRIAKPIPEPTV